MKKCLLFLGAAALISSALHAEYTFFTPPGSFTVEVSLENSPYSPRLPINRNAITSLEVVGDYAIGATSAAPGLSPFFFAVSLSRKRLEIVSDLAETLPGQRSVRSGFGRGAGQVLFAGTLPDKSGDSGHLVQISLQEQSLKVQDLGVPVTGEGIFALTADRKSGRLYGLSYPSGKFFMFEPGTKHTEIFDQTAPSRRTIGFLHDYALEPENYLSRRLALDGKGRVYGSQPVNKIFRFDPVTKTVELLKDELPETWGRRPLGSADAWALAADGTLYGSNAADGQLFRLDPETGRITNLGKPAMMPRLPGLAFGADGRLYGVTGSAPGYAHLFSYAPHQEGFRDLGNPRFTMTEPGIEQGIAWRGFQIGTVAASEDGRWIVLGEEETLSQLMVFPVK